MQTCAIFGDSLFRSIVEGHVALPTGSCQLIVNSTPGGRCLHIKKEVENFSFPRRPDLVVIEAGTNNLGGPLEETAEEFRGFLKSALLISKVRNKSGPMREGLF